MNEEKMNPMGEDRAPDLAPHQASHRANPGEEGPVSPGANRVNDALTAARVDLEGLTDEEIYEFLKERRAQIIRNEEAENIPGNSKRLGKVMQRIYKVIIDRKKNPLEGSYTNYLLDKGREKIIKKFGEESIELILASMAGDKAQVAQEAADIIYHFAILLADQGMTFDDVAVVLEQRRDSVNPHL